jgi:hypothetical protein
MPSRKFRTVSGALHLAACSLLLLIATTGTSANAASYCWWSPTRIEDSGASTTQLTIVVASVPRVPIPGRPTNRPWCTQRWRSIGGHMESRIVERPRLGTVNSGGYVIRYRGDKVGHDRFVAEITWLHWANTNRQKATVTFDIDVVPEPF